ncbi:MAG: cation diffusion facilitator family transporter [Mycobacteriales bacterium]
MTRDDRLLLVATGLLAGFLAAELSVALAYHSLALLADAGHMVTDVIALSAVVVAARLARRPAVGHWTFGLARAEVLSAAINGVTLLVVAVIVLVEAIRRLVTPAHPSGTAMITIGMVGLAVDMIAAVVLSRTERQ